MAYTRILDIPQVAITLDYRYQRFSQKVSKNLRILLVILFPSYMATMTTSDSRDFHIPPGLVVDRWASNGENGSHRHFLFRQEVWTMFRHQISKEITSIISTAWHFTTKSGGIWKIIVF